MIQYGGEFLALETRELQDFTNHNLPFCDTRATSGHLGLSSSRFEAIGNYPVGERNQEIGLGLPNYPPPPAPRINALYWPTGASRWAWFYGLCSKEQKDRILAKGGANGVRLPLVLTDEQNNITIAPNMTCLPPRPVSCVDDKLWLLPLVDDRYFWQYKHTDDLTVTDATPWTTLYQALATQLGIVLAVDPIPAAYFYPDPTECSRKYENAAVLLDAVAHSVGQRIVCSIGGEIRALNWDVAQQRLAANLQGPWTQIAGHDFSSQIRFVPGFVQVAFRAL